MVKFMATGLSHADVRLRAAGFAMRNVVVDIIRARLSKYTSMVAPVVGGCLEVANPSLSYSEVRSCISQVPHSSAASWAAEEKHPPGADSAKTSPWLNN
jgi:hypothetical protein